MRFAPKILLVDHEPYITAALRRALKAIGHCIIREERDDRAVLNAARWFQPDLILLDRVIVSQSDSILAQALRDDPRLSGIPLVCLNALLPGDRLASNGFLGGYNFSISPVGIDEIVGVVRDLVSAPAH